ncbi:hypothetical protein PL11201_370013 [Planktothrix sp. PCC 11201]|nr:hypothetical protein PL11201_370013 [Planktothrix sp. PCC 11201]
MLSNSTSTKCGETNHVLRDEPQPTAYYPSGIGLGSSLWLYTFGRIIWAIILG